MQTAQDCQTMHKMQSRKQNRESQLGYLRFQALDFIHDHEHTCCRRTGSGLVCFHSHMCTDVCSLNTCQTHPQRSMMTSQLHVNSAVHLRRNRPAQNQKYSLGIRICMCTLCSLNGLTCSFQSATKFAASTSNTLIIVSHYTS